MSNLSSTKKISYDFNYIIILSFIYFLNINTIISYYIDKNIRLEQDNKDLMMIQKSSLKYDFYFSLTQIYRESEREREKNCWCLRGIYNHMPVKYTISTKIHMQKS